MTKKKITMKSQHIGYLQLNERGKITREHWFLNIRKKVEKE